MPLELQIIRSQEFVRIGAQEHFDFEASKGALALLAAACRKRGVDRALLDLRDLPILPSPMFTPAQLAALVDTFREAGFSRQQKLAVLYRSDPHHGARLFALIGTFKGWRVRAFDNFEAALLWLSAGTEKRGEEEQDQVIPVQRRERSISLKLSPAGPELPRRSKYPRHTTH